MLLETLTLWNRWGKNPLPSGIARDITPKIVPYLHTDEIIPLTGPRRSGKSTVLYQLMDVLEKEGVPEEAVLHINFEEPNLTPLLSTEGLDELYSTFRTHVYPEGKAYLFLDEIQNVPSWEKWVRARTRTEDIKVFVTGSSAKMMSRELASLLTGRHLSFEILPLSFSEFLRFNKIAMPDVRLPIAASAPIRNALENYMRWGGFPKVVLSESPEYKRDILTAYFDDILFKDILLRHSIKDTMLLRSIVTTLLTQTGTLVSYQRIANLFQVSNDLSINYCNYAVEAYLFEFLSFYSVKSAIRHRHPKKIHALDVGLRNAVSLAHSADEGHIIETLVYGALRRRFGENIFYWQEEGEIDFLIHQGTKITHIFQVVAGKLDDEKVLNREISALSVAKGVFREAEAILIAKDMPKNIEKIPFKVVPLWLFLLE